MPAVVTSHTEMTPVQVSFPLDWVTMGSGILHRAVIDGADRPLRVWVHTMNPGASICWRNSKVGSVVYIWKGHLEDNGRTIPTHGSVLVEHRGNFDAHAGSEGATLIHFFERDGINAHTSRPGGNVHRTGADGIFKGISRELRQTYEIFADSNCASCEMWLHGIQFDQPRPTGAPHYHTEDEIIFVVDGEMKLGRNTLGPGTAIAVDAKTVYSFGIGSHGLKIINYRPCEPFYVLVNPDRTHRPMMNEREILMASERVSPQSSTNAK